MGMTETIRGEQRDRRRAMVRSVLASHAVGRARAGGEKPTTRQLDPFMDEYGDCIIAPPYSLSHLANMLELSDSVYKCSAAMAANIGGHGWTLVPSEDKPHPEDQEDPAWVEINAEKLHITRFFRYISAEMSFTRLRYQTRMDLESVGNAYWEILRDAEGNIVGAEWVSAQTIRLGPRAMQPVDVERWERDSERGGWQKMTRRCRPRVYVQNLEGQRAWFKELGDPRILNWRTGRFEGEGEDGPVALPDRATEIIHWRLHVSTRSPYGMPRWISAVNQAAGRAEAASKNLSIISRNGMPSAILMLWGIEEADVDSERISEQYMEMQRSDKESDLLIISVAPKDADPMEAVKSQSPKGELIKTNDLQREDALYMKYAETAEAAVIETYRLSPITIGKSQDYTRSTAEAAKRVVQEQVFGPEAREEDFVINERILPELGAIWWTFKTLAAPSSDESIVGTMVQALSESAGITPRMAKQLAEKFLGVKAIGHDQPWEDIPASVLQQWVIQGYVPPSEDLLEAMGVLVPEDDTGPEEEPDAPDEEPDEGGKESARSRRSRALRRRLRAACGADEAEQAVRIARLVVRGLLEARKRLEDEEEED